MFPLFLSLFLGIAAPRLKAEEPGGNGVAAFSDPARIWGNGVERVIEEAYRQSFKTYIIDGKVMNLRMPFAQNNERSELSGKNWQFLGGGKADPGYLWEAIGSVLAGEDFRRYAEVLADGREKVIIFDIPSQTWTASRDLFDLSRMKAGSYRGLPHRPYVLVSGRGIEEPDVYNYLYCIGWVGMDCSGFVWHVLTYVAQAGGLNLGRALSRALGISGNQSPSLYAGTSFFNSGDREIIAVQDEIRNLRPADIILFRGADGGVVHSAIIQSVDLSGGVIRYLQSTDEAPLNERGAHESFIRFDPEHPELSLKDPAAIWTQARYPPFPGERASPFSDDGKRYRAFPEFGGGRVVRLRVMAAPVEKINSLH
ncbi:MAG: peptidoglycan endopeptidase [Treponema sp.]|nr:peptidoglycan endopeptidase [Treponema sp.]